MILDVGQTENFSADKLLKSVIIDYYKGTSDALISQDIYCNIFSFYFKLL